MSCWGKGGGRVRGKCIPRKEGRSGGEICYREGGGGGLSWKVGIIDGAVLVIRSWGET